MINHFPITIFSLLYIKLSLSALRKRVVKIKQILNNTYLR